MIKKIGVQLFTIRDFMKTEEDVRASFKKLKAMGYDQGQTAGCAIPYEAYGRIAREEGIEIVGTHDNFNLMYEDFDAALQNHKLLNTKYMGTGGFFSKSWQEYEEAIEKFNTINENAEANGMKFTYHNHSHEFVRRENGKTCMEMLVEDYKGSFCLDTYWVQHGGGDVRQWIEKLAGRIDILHLKDMAKNDEAQFITEVGNGNLYWEGILKTAVDTGVKYFVVEQDTCPGDPFESLKISREYLDKFIG